ncbi:hypothetical protein [Flavobacterium ardleyense]|uniref:hypothetical protein n=1 Tax=Flavobacterium ardleyense TaxID=2038737 RepID=UPI00298C6044|nr:hypothetical protein [Flavobacterium ardleyense]
MLLTENVFCDVNHEVFFSSVVFLAAKIQWMARLWLQLRVLKYEFENVIGFAVAAASRPRKTLHFAYTCNEAVAQLDHHPVNSSVAILRELKASYGHFYIV